MQDVTTEGVEGVMSEYRPKCRECRKASTTDCTRADEVGVFSCDDCCDEMLEELLERREHSEPTEAS